MLYSGNQSIDGASKPVGGSFVTIDGEAYYQIRNYDSMQPFFISLASDTDLWMYISSTGGLTAGRRSPDSALFPYYTDDKITEQADWTGPKTIVRATVKGRTMLWEPFSDRQQGVYDIERTISKSVVGNKLIFCEENKSLHLRFEYRWAACDAYGWVRRATLRNLSFGTVDVELLDGLQNVLPSGADRLRQNTFSNLVDAYKKTELVAGSPLVLFRLEAILVDRAEPSESLRCNTVYTLGLDGTFLLSSRQVNDFRCGRPVEPEPESKGVRGAAMIMSEFALSARKSLTWYQVADVERDAVQVRALQQFSVDRRAIRRIERAIKQSTSNLHDIVALNDGVQQTSDPHDMARHFANTLFNTMRGGFYCDGYMIDARAFEHHVTLFNKAVAARHAGFLSRLEGSIDRHALYRQVCEQNDPQLTRLFFEYLPLTFSRRHGDPSRPWNLFNIRVNDSQGHRLISYQGNWRDIFQNWEALSLSYPDYINGIIAKFLNATTIDGYNPYKITSEGIDWEVIEPDNPWSNIGYWGDHQIVYLMRLLRLSYRHNPDALAALFNERLFAFANVPYRLKSYNAIRRDPKDSITFDQPLHDAIMNRLADYGQDARLVLDKKGQVVLTTFTDKLAITLLAKLSNMIPEAGIWMNTLRPEWNDANNALVGNGASVVTLCYIRQMLEFLIQIYTEHPLRRLRLSVATHELMRRVGLALRKAVSAPMTDLLRRQVTDDLGRAGEHYRAEVYRHPEGRMVDIAATEWLEFLHTAMQAVDASVRVNRRADGLYHAYNLVTFEANTLHVDALYEMLEGQVAVLSSGLLTADETITLLDQLRRSPLYRPDQRSYMLYPDRRRPQFLQVNNLPNEAYTLPVVRRMLRRYPGKILIGDVHSGLHFNPDFKNASYLSAALDSLPKRVPQRERSQLLDLYEQVFSHHAFTGRSGTFYKYEGLGSIYWHMVSKLLLAVGESIERFAADGQTTAAQLNHLRSQYAAIREGIGAHKSPAEYGSFPFDAYSHTPSMAGVQQPGMTGQVKEDLISRYIELGVRVSRGQITFSSLMFEPDQMLQDDVRFTYCAQPIVYRLGKHAGIDVTMADGTQKHYDSLTLPATISSEVFGRTKLIKEILVTFTNH